MATKITQILHKRGLEAFMPTLQESEMAYTTDTQQVFIGTSTGNKPLTAKVEQDLAALQVNFIDLAIEVETNKNAELTGVDANIVIETFVNLDDVVVERGNYDATNKWLEV